MKLLAIILAVLSALAIAYDASCRDFSSWRDACNPYRAQVESILKSEGVDTAYYFLMVAESRCTKDAVSPKGARGFWQMMPATAKHYSCSDLSDLQCSTRAAARYIKRLQSEFKSFDSVIMAWNMGGHNYARNGAGPEAKGLLRRVKAIMSHDANTDL